MWDKVIDVVGREFPVAILFAAWALTTFVYYRRQHADHVATLKEAHAKEIKGLTDANAARIADLKSQITSLKRERAALRKKSRRKDEGD